MVISVWFRISSLLRLTAAYLMANKPALAFATHREADQLYERKKLNEFDIRLALEKQYVDYFQAVGQWQQAFSHVNKLHELETSRLLADNDGVINRLNIEYETEKKESLLKVQRKELALRDENLRTQQRFTLATSALLVMAVGMSLVFFRLSRAHLVNLDYIKRLKDNGLMPSDEKTVLPVPATIRKGLLKKLTIVRTKCSIHTYWKLNQYL